MTLVFIALGCLSIVGGAFVEAMAAGHGVGGGVSNVLVLFTNPAAFVIIFGGSFMSGFASSTDRDVKSLMPMFKWITQKRTFDYAGIISKLITYSEKARKEGLLSLESQRNEDDPELLQKGLQLVIDGTDPDMTREILENMVEREKSESKRSANMFETVGGFSPTLGVLAAIMGLVSAIGALATGTGPEAITKALSGISVAFLGSFWGVFLANVILIPLANKARNEFGAIQLEMELVVRGVLSIQAGDNPRLLREQLMALLPKDLAGDETAEVAAG